MRSDRGEHQTRRLNSLICNIVIVAILLVCVAVVIGFTITRTHMFHVAYGARTRDYTNNVWLVEQCKSAEFYSNMKQHSSLCEDVEKLQNDSLWLHALRDVIDKTSLCGSLSCEAVLQLLVTWVAMHSMYLAGLCICAVLVIAFLIIPWQRRFMANHQIMHRDSELALRARFACSPYDNIGQQTFDRRASYTSEVRGRVPQVLTFD